MDNHRFDALAKTLTEGGSRRRILQSVGVAGLAAVFGRFEMASDAEARKKGKNKKRKRRKKATPAPVACPDGQATLSNGSCAIVCDELADCPAGCGCNGPNTEGVRPCAAGGACEDIPQVCIDTADCPPGQSCFGTGCGVGGSVENRCVPLCVD